MKRLLVVSLVMLGLVGCSSKFPKDGLTRVKIFSSEERGSVYFLKEVVTMNNERLEEGVVKEVVIETYPSEAFRVKNGLQGVKYMSSNVILKCTKNVMISKDETTVYDDGKIDRSPLINEVGDLAPDSILYDTFCK